ncbi:MAG: hypothetical protein HY731_03525 [Candidatus Tectomicrobia bacterium]|nr:hypothetical protein [Candidatus Tectomicrobia bacterium]
MKTRLSALIIFSLLVVYPEAVSAKGGRERDGLVGPVHTVVIETERVLTQFSGQWVKTAPTRTSVSTGSWIKKTKTKRVTRVSESNSELVEVTYRTIITYK